jgi:hypothetical protein
MTGDMPFDQEVFGEQLLDTRPGAQSPFAGDGVRYLANLATVKSMIFFWGGWSGFNEKTMRKLQDSHGTIPPKWDLNISENVFKHGI